MLYLKNYIISLCIYIHIYIFIIPIYIISIYVILYILYTYLKNILILISVINNNEEMKQDMPGFSCDVAVISAFTPVCAFQMFTANEQNLIDLCSNMFS